MNDKNSDAISLRTEAEATIAREPISLVNPQPGEELLHKLLHELQVHQVELKMQNDELRQAQIAMEESRDRYVDLYDFAPIGYLTLSPEGMISEINLTAADMLGVVRKQLVSRRFSQFVVQNDRERWDRHFVSVLQHSQRQRCEVSIERGDGSVFHAQLDSVNCCELGESPLPETKKNRVAAVRIALSDITERIQNETALVDARALVESFLDTVHEPLIVLDSTLNIVSASNAFYKHFRLMPEETTNRRIFELSQHRWDIPMLRALLETGLQQSPRIKDFEIEQDFPAIGKRKLKLNAQRITGKTGVTQTILLAINDVTGQK